MLCVLCGSVLVTRHASLLVCPSLSCQLIHDTAGKPEGWSVGAGSVPGYLFPYEKVLSLWAAADKVPSDLRALHIAAMVEIALRLALEHYAETIATALKIQLEK